jgi:NAD-dependent DNA ligase
MDSKEVEYKIRLRRNQCLLARICYYCYDDPLLPDYEYDRREAELRKLSEAYPEIAKSVEHYEICPSRIVGSDNINDYPIELVRKAQSLLDYAAKLR